MLARVRGHHLPVVWHADAALRLPGLPMDPLRARRVLGFLAVERLVRTRDIGHPAPASVAAMLRVHSTTWVEALDDPTQVGIALGTPVNEDERRGVVAVQRLQTGGTILAARTAWRQGGLVAHLGGGFHHATPNRGMGFCLINDVAIAIRHLRHYGCDGPILVVDLDLHDGNGTRAAFAEDDSVHTLSIHNTDWEPLGGVANTSLALGSGVDDATYLAAVREVVPRIVASHRPAMVFYVAGTDPAADDRLGDWRISADGLFERDRFVLETLRAHRPDLPVVTVLAGGYGASAWRYTARFLAWAAAGRRLEPPDELTLAVGRLRSAGAAPVAETGDDWGLTEEDLLGVAPVGGTRRVLGRYTPLAIELSLERAGILGALRDLGYHPVVVTDTSSPVGDTITVFGDDAHTELLMELRVGRSRTVFSGMEVLVAEWLRLQDPRQAFSDSNPRLPGQDHPGLGLLREVVAWVVLLCEALGLDGLVFTPAQYYMAALARHHMQFVRPEAIARFEAIEKAAGGLPLSEAEQRLAAGGVSWDGREMMMVYPVSDRLRHYLAGTGRPE